MRDTTSARNFDVSRIDASFGAAIHGVDLSKNMGNLSLINALIDQLHEHRLIVIKNQTLTLAQYSAFGKIWGNPIIHPLAYTRPESMTHGFPEIVFLQNTGEAARDEKHRLSAVFWHTDHTSEADPSSKTMLYCIKAPAQGGQTQFADMVGAYNALPEKTKTRIDKLIAIHEYGAGAREAGEYDPRAMLTEEDKKRYSPTRHPLVLRHPYFNGRKALFAVAGTPVGIEGMPQDEAEALLKELKTHALQPSFRYDHKYVPGDLVVWDTLATLHSASALPYAEREENIRLMWRISCRGAPSGAHQPAQNVTA